LNRVNLPGIRRTLQQCKNGLWWSWKSCGHGSQPSRIKRWKTNCSDQCQHPKCIIGSILSSYNHEYHQTRGARNARNARNARKASSTWSHRKMPSTASKSTWKSVKSNKG
jgi:hypothetical protein